MFHGLAEENGRLRTAPVEVESRGELTGGEIAGVVVVVVVVGGSAVPLMSVGGVVAVVLVVASLTLPGARPGPFPSIFASIQDGFRYAFREPGLRTIVIYMTVNSLLAAPFIALALIAA